MEAAEQRLAAAAAEAEASLAAPVAPLQQQLAAAQEAAQGHEQACEKAQTELAQAVEQAQQLAAGLQAAQQEAASLRGQLEAASGSRDAAEEQAQALAAEVEALRQQCQQLQAAAQHAQQAAATAVARDAEDSGLPANHAVQDSGSNAGGGELAAAGAGTAGALAEEVESLRQAAAHAEKQLAAGLAVQQARVVALEKQNRELSWQVAMLTRGGSAAGPAGGGSSAGGRVGIGGPPGSVVLPMPAAQLEGSTERPVAVAVGWVLRHRRQLMGAYLALLHLLVYVLASLLSRCGHPAAAAGAG